MDTTFYEDIKTRRKNMKQEHIGAGHVTDVTPPLPVHDELHTTYHLQTRYMYKTRHEMISTLHYDAKDKKTKHNKPTRGPKSNSDT